MMMKRKHVSLFRRIITAATHHHIGPPFVHFFSFFRYYYDGYLFFFDLNVSKKKKMKNRSAQFRSRPWLIKLISTHRLFMFVLLFFFATFFLGGIWIFPSSSSWLVGCCCHHHHYQKPTIDLLAFPFWFFLRVCCFNSTPFISTKLSSIVLFFFFWLEPTFY